MKRMRVWLSVVTAVILMAGVFGPAPKAFAGPGQGTEHGNGNRWLSMDVIAEQDVSDLSVTVNGSNWNNGNDVFKTDGNSGGYTIVISAKSNDEEQYAVSHGLTGRHVGADLVAPHRGPPGQ